MTKLEAARRLMDCGVSTVDREDIEAAARYAFEHEEDGSDAKLKAAETLASFSANGPDEYSEAVLYVFEHAEE